MKFSNLTIVSDGSDKSFVPYDRGANGAFVYRKSGQTVHAPRLVVSTKADDSASDRYSVALSEPRLCESIGDCTTAEIKGVDLVKTDLRFLADTSIEARKLQLDDHIALLQELRDTIANREVIYP